MDPFLQAAVTLDGRVTRVGDNTSAVPGLRYGQKIDMGRLMPYIRERVQHIEPGNILPDPFIQEFDFPLTSAVYDGIGRSVRNTTGDPLVYFQCSTGNCTWPVFTTAGTSAPPSSDLEPPTASTKTERTLP